MTDENIDSGGAEVQATGSDVYRSVRGERIRGDNESELEISTRSEGR